MGLCNLDMELDLRSGVRLILPSRGLWAKQTWPKTDLGGPCIPGLHSGSAVTPLGA